MSYHRLAIYLNDHLALLVGEAALARRCESSNRGTPLGDFLHRLGNDVEAQRKLIRDVIRRIGKNESRVKQGAAWAAERLGRFKLNGSLLSYSDLSRLVEIEALTAMAQERVAMWETLDMIAAGDSLFDEVDCAALRDQSYLHRDELATLRQEAARLAFPPTVRVAVRNSAH